MWRDRLLLTDGVYTTVRVPVCANATLFIVTDVQGMCHVQDAVPWQQLPQRSVKACHGILGPREYCDTYAQRPLQAISGEQAVRVRDKGRPRAP